MKNLFFYMILFVTLIGCEHKDLLTPSSQSEYAATKSVEPIGIQPWTSLAVQVSQNGKLLEGVEVSFSRSLSGVTPAYLWKGVTDEGGWAEIPISADEAFAQTGTTGYYQAKATDLTTHKTIGRWNSIPINRGEAREVLLETDHPARFSTDTGLERVIFRENGTDPLYVINVWEDRNIVSLDRALRILPGDVGLVPRLFSDHYIIRAEGNFSNVDHYIVMIYENKLIYSQQLEEIVELPASKYEMKTFDVPSGVNSLQYLAQQPAGVDPALYFFIIDTGDIGDNTGTAEISFHNDNSSPAFYTVQIDAAKHSISIADVAATQLLPKDFHASAIPEGHFLHHPNVTCLWFRTFEGVFRAYPSVSTDFIQGTILYAFGLQFPPAVQ